MSSTEMKSHSLYLHKLFFLVFSKSFRPLMRYILGILSVSSIFLKYFFAFSISLSPEFHANNTFRSDFQFTMLIKPCLSRVWGFLVVSRCSLNSLCGNSLSLWFKVHYSGDNTYLPSDRHCSITNQGTNVNSWISF